MLSKGFTEQNILHAILLTHVIILAHSVLIWTGMFVRERNKIEPSDLSQRLPWTFLGWTRMVEAFACLLYGLTGNYL